MDYKKKYLKYKLKYLNAKKTLIGGNPKMMHHQNSSNDDDETYSCKKGCTDYAGKIYKSMGCLEDTLENMHTFKFYPDILKKKDGEWKVDVTNWSDTKLEQAQKELETIRETTRNVILNRCWDLTNKDVKTHEEECNPGWDWYRNCYSGYHLKDLDKQNNFLKLFKDPEKPITQHVESLKNLSYGAKNSLEKFENDIRERTKMVSIFNEYPENQKLLERIYKDLKQLKDVPQDTTQLKNILINVYSKLLRKYRYWNYEYIFMPQERANTTASERYSGKFAFVVPEEEIPTKSKEAKDEVMDEMQKEFNGEGDWVDELIDIIWKYLRDTYNISYKEAETMIEEMN